MKNMKKLFSLVLALVMMMALVVTAGAEETGTITIKNASIGETYSAFKLFDAKDNGNGSITYTGTIPASLEAYFEVIPATELGAGQIRVKDAGKDSSDSSGKTLSEDAVNALKAWAQAEADKEKLDDKTSGEYLNRVVPVEETATVENTKNGHLVLTVPDGYYVIISTSGTGAAVTVDSTNPNAEVYDKNTNTPSWPDDGKTVNGVSFDVGDTATYTVTFKTVNWVGTGKDAKQVTKYTIIDNFADGKLANISVSSITIGGDAYTATNNFATTGTIEIPWTDASGNSIYANDAEIVITYTATVVAEGDVTNHVDAKYTTSDGDINVPGKDATVYNTVIGTDKHNPDGEKLSGAKFKLYRAVDENNTDEVAAAAGTGFVYYSKNGNDVQWVSEANALELATGTDGTITGFSGLKALKDENGVYGVYYLVETEAPDGYNKLAEPIEVKIVEVTDANGTHLEVQTSAVVENEVVWSPVTNGAVDVVNQSGTELPSTGGIGTTIFYVVGGVLMVGAAILFLTKKRSEA